MCSTVLVFAFRGNENNRTRTNEFTEERSDPGRECVQSAGVCLPRLAVKCKSSSESELTEAAQPPPAKRDANASKMSATYCSTDRRKSFLGFAIAFSRKMWYNIEGGANYERESADSVYAD